MQKITEENKRLKLSQSEGLNIFHDCVLTVRDRLNFTQNNASILSDPDYIRVMDLFTQHPKIE